MYKFQEELFIKRINASKNHNFFNAIFKFDIVENIISRLQDNNGPNMIHYGLFSSSLADTMIKYSLNRLIITFSHTKWKSNIYGSTNFMSDIPSGISVFAQFRSNVDIETEWESLTNLLSGMLCTSIGTSARYYTIDPSDFINDSSGQSMNKWAIIPFETVCTENFAPWKKMLPCKKQGLIYLVNEIVWFSKHYIALRIDLTSKINQLYDATIYQISFNSTLNSLTTGMDVPSSLYIKHLFLHLFGKFYTNDNFCSIPYNASMLHFLNIDKNQSESSINIADLLNISENGKLIFSKSSQYLYENMYNSHKYLTGYSRHMATLNVIISKFTFNQDLTNLITMSYLQIIPFFLKIYVSTLKIRAKLSNGTIHDCKDIKLTLKMPIKQKSNNYQQEAASFLQIYLFNKRPGIFDPQCFDSLNDIDRITISMSILFKLFAWHKYPPDSNHGFYIPGGLLKYNCENNKSDKNETRVIDKTVYDDALLLLLPTPDFSMPYNVLCISCTVLALSFGTIFNYCSKIFLKGAFVYDRTS
ncbi:GPI transamidase component PIG-T-like isoform X2 [Gordionus sp. m RMFG-2023]|uniref:GPI transamidase component PIG-T-like isoform X2 n=1 Tax=Gordionus sp. m RMFG-2023 TaxID=3053472 RepID=UPI0031FE1424